MRVCLIGYGKMGKAIEQILLFKKHEISGRIDHNNQGQLTESLKNSDVAIEFSNPEAALENLKACFDFQVPVICGTTAWLEKWPEMEAYLHLKNGSLIYASNFSVGVQLFFELNRMLAKIMDRQTEYICSLKEIHHTHKKDAPSGTALSLAKDILSIQTKYKNWSLIENASENDLKITADRKEAVVGTHYVSYSSGIDQIEIKHEAFNREGFALGAVLAAEWILDKKGIFTMSDVLDLKAG